MENHRRAAGRHERRERAAQQDGRGAAGRDPAERFVERDAILGAFAALSESDREALRLVAWDGLRLAEAAGVAGVSRPAFAMRLHRARRRLAAQLDVPSPTTSALLEDAP